MGTIAKAMQKHKTELAGPAKNLPEAGPAQNSEVQVNPPQPPPDLKSSPADVFRRGARTPGATESQIGRGITTEPVDKGSTAVPISEERTHLSGLSVTKKSIDPSLISLTNPDGIEADLFRILRTRILFPQVGQPPRTILVTSAQAEEGKSFIAANLAINMARSVDQHVLLVDCDLRKPSIHSKFGLNGAKGLSEYLSSKLDIASLLIKTDVEKLTILPSGEPPQNPSELITSAKMAALIQELKARYHDRYIILDSPPPMMAPETSAVAKWVDGVLLVVKYAITPMDLVEELMTHLDRDKIIGAVINKINAREFRRYPYKNYYRYSNRKQSKDGRHPLS